MKRFSRRHWLAIEAALDCDISARLGAAHNELGERIDPEGSEDAIDAIVPDQEAALKLVRERLEAEEASS